MNELRVVPNRYNGQSVALEIHAGRLRTVCGQTVIEISFGEEDEFEILFETAGLPVDDSLLEQARSLMNCIGDLDNKVQESCAEECRRTGLHPRNFESMLAYIRLSQNLARLHYFGTGVNTEWDELVELHESSWQYVGTASQLGKASEA